MDKYRDVACPTCAQQPNEACMSQRREVLPYVHSSRIQASRMLADPGADHFVNVHEMVDKVANDLI